MSKATGLLGSMLQHVTSSSSRDRLGRALDQDQRSGGPLGGLLSRFGGGEGGVLGNLMGALNDRNRDPQADKDYVMGLARRAVSSPREELSNNNPLAVGGLGALVGTLMGGGRGAVGGALLAVIGSLAYSALQSGDGQGDAAAKDRQPMPAASTTDGGPGDAAVGSASGGYGRPGEATLAATDEDVDRMARLVLRSMIQAAKADGHIDAAEIERITGRIEEGDPADAAEARSIVLEQMRGPVDMAGLVAEVRSPLEAAEVYTAALMAIEVDSPAETAYLARLAEQLGLQHDTVARLHAALDAKPPA